MARHRINRVTRLFTTMAPYPALAAHQQGAGISHPTSKNAIPPDRISPAIQRWALPFLFEIPFNSYFRSSLGAGVVALRACSLSIRITIHTS